MTKPAHRVATIAVIGGDGIGPEVTEAALPILSAAASLDHVQLDFVSLPLGASHYLATGETLSQERFDFLANHVDAILLGALGDPRVPGNQHARDILLGLRFRLDLYTNFRPCTLLHTDLCPLKSSNGRPREIDFVIFRENTEGSYLGRGTIKDAGTANEEAIAEEVHTAPKVSRIIQAAFEWARDHDKQRISVSDKSNAIPAHRMWRRIADDISQSFPGIDLEYRYVDALAMELVRDPERFQVIVTNNLFGDILSDLGAQLVGGLGVAASANLHPGKPGLFEPVHGSAPPLVGTHSANPLGAILTGQLMLQQLGAAHGATAVETAVRRSLNQGVTTPDLGGSQTTDQVARFILAELS